MTKIGEDLELLNPNELFSKVFTKIIGNPRTFVNKSGSHFVQGAHGDNGMQMIMHIIDSSSMTIILHNTETSEVVANKNNQFPLDNIETVDLLTEISKGLETPQNDAL